MQPSKYVYVLYVFISSGTSPFSLIIFRLQLGPETVDIESAFTGDTLFGTRPNNLVALTLLSDRRTAEGSIHTITWSADMTQKNYDETVPLEAEF